MAQASALQLITIQAVYWQRCKWTAIFTIIFFSLRLLLFSYNSSLNEKVFHQKLLGVGQHPPSPLVGWRLIFFFISSRGEQTIKIKNSFPDISRIFGTNTLWSLPPWGWRGHQKLFNIFPNSGNSRRISFFVKFPVFVQDFNRFWHEQLFCIHSLLKGRLTMMLGCELLFSFLLRHSFSCKGTSKLATRGFQNVRLGLKKGPSLGYWILWTTFAKKSLHGAF